MRAPTSNARFGPAVLVFVAAAACGTSSPSNPGAPSSGGSTSSSGGGGEGGAPVLSGGGDDAGPSDGAAPVTPVDSGTSPEAGGSSTNGGDGSALVPAIPAPTGTCPTFANGMATFSPSGIAARQAQIYMSSAAQTKPGPLILYWYATGSSTAEVEYSLGTTLQTIEDAGGVVIAPVADPSAGQFEWYIVNGSSKLDDFLVADEIVGCAAKSGLIDTTHVHSMGMSAGALQTTAFGFMRSSYIASVTTYSGGMPPGFTPTIENPANKFAAFIFDGGSTDDLYGIDFQAASQTFDTTLKNSGHFAAICDHGMGHAIPTAAAPSVALFFQANGFGVSPSPYAGGLPSSFPSYCTL